MKILKVLDSSLDKTPVCWYNLGETERLRNEGRGVRVRKGRGGNRAGPAWPVTDFPLGTASGCCARPRPLCQRPSWSDKGL